MLEADASLSAEASGSVSTIVQAEARLERLLDAAREIAAARNPMHHGAVALGVVILPASGIDVEISGVDVVFPLSQDGLGIVLGHLVNNAARAGASRVSIVASMTRGGQVLTVADDGPGISPGNRDKCFEPFFTTRRDAGGTGMGLAIVQTLVLANGGDISLEPSETGALFRIVF